ncbi:MULTISPECIES: hypothetical protein [unclassified Flagellimonas]|uniref:Uncharacterized protein n=1 Tax=Flagellimonas sp. MMG031 TaxID=3158549 RepID=A0AAU7MY89_9FLAO|nr:hypothetical protein [Allomuricauda sp.]
MDKDETFSDWIIDNYGSPEQLSQILELGMFMLFFLEVDTFSRREIQDVAEAMRSISIRLRNQGSIELTK